MNNQWFECKVKYEKTMENGLVKKVNEPYLVDALNFTEAERRIIEEITPFMTGEFEELFEAPGDDSADKYFRAKLVFITLDEKSGKEKKTSQNVLIQAGDLRDAIRRLDEGMKDSMMDYTIASVTETALMDIFHYTLNKPGEDKPEYE